VDHSAAVDVGEASLGQHRLAWFVLAERACHDPADFALLRDPTDQQR